MIEEWKFIEGYYGRYKISNLGNIISYVRDKNGKLMKPSLAKGYYRVKLSINDEYNTVSIHRLVATYFVKNPNDYDIVNHIDGNKTNNVYTNLEWCTISQNSQHSYDNGLQISIKGNKHGRSKLSKEDAYDILNNANMSNLQEYANKYNVGLQCVKDIVTRRRWVHL